MISAPYISALYQQYKFINKTALSYLYFIELRNRLQENQSHGSLSYVTENRKTICEMRLASLYNEKAVYALDCAYTAP